jgi:hypothetical protein
LSLDKQEEYAKELVKKFADVLGDELVTALLTADQKNENLAEQRARVALLKPSSLRRQLPRGQGPQGARRQPGASQRLDLRRRRLGLRHRVRRLWTTCCPRVAT